MPEPSALPEGPTFKRLQGQIDWYSAKSGKAKRAFKSIKVIEILAAAIIPFLGSLPIQRLKPHLVFITGALGVLITILEGILHLNQFQENWTTYRSTAEALKHEKYLYLANAGPYAKTATTDTTALLAERVEALVSQEHSQWTNLQQQSTKGQSTTQS